MDAMELLTTRASNGKLTEPAPDDVTLQRIFQAAVRAPDHGLLRPYRFFTIRGDARHNLGALFAEALRADDPNTPEAKIEQITKKPLRAPLIIVVAALPQDNPKVPAIEQQLCAGTAAHSILLGLQALGYAGMWRTGPMAYHPTVAAGFDLKPKDSLIGFIYVGTPEMSAPPLQRPEAMDHVVAWSGPSAGNR